MAFLAGKGFVILNRKAEQGDQKAKDLLSKLNSIDQDEADRLFSEILGKGGSSGSKKEKKTKAPGASATDGQGEITEGAGEQAPTGKATPKAKGEAPIAAPDAPTGEVKPKSKQQLRDMVDGVTQQLSKIESSGRKINDAGLQKLADKYGTSVDSIMDIASQNGVDLESIYKEKKAPTGKVKPKAAEQPGKTKEQRTKVEELAKKLVDEGEYNYDDIADILEDNFGTQDENEPSYYDVVRTYGDDDNRPANKNKKPKAGKVYPGPAADPLDEGNLETLFKKYKGNEDKVLDDLRSQLAGAESDPENPLSNSDLQGIVEAYAITRGSTKPVLPGKNKQAAPAAESNVPSQFEGEKDAAKFSVFMSVKDAIDDDLDFDENEIKQIANEYGLTKDEVSQIIRGYQKRKQGGTTIDTAGANVQPAGAFGDIEPETQQLEGQYGGTGTPRDRASTILEELVATRDEELTDAELQDIADKIGNISFEEVQDSYSMQKNQPKDELQKSKKKFAGMGNEIDFENAIGPIERLQYSNPENAQGFKDRVSAIIEREGNERPLGEEEINQLAQDYGLTEDEVDKAMREIGAEEASGDTTNPIAEITDKVEVKNILSTSNNIVEGTLPNGSQFTVTDTGTGLKFRIVNGPNGDEEPRTFAYENSEDMFDLMNDLGRENITPDEMERQEFEANLDPIEQEVDKRMNEYDARANEIINGIEQFTSGGQFELSDDDWNDYYYEMQRMSTSSPIAEKWLRENSPKGNANDQETLSPDEIDRQEFEANEELENLGAQGYNELIQEIKFNPTIIRKDEIEKVAQKLQLEGKTPEQLQKIRDGVVKSWEQTSQRGANINARAGMSAITAAIDQYIYTPPEPETSAQPESQKINKLQGLVPLSLKEAGIDETTPTGERGPKYRELINQLGNLEKKRPDLSKEINVLFEQLSNELDEVIGKPAQAPAQIKQTAQANTQAAGVQKQPQQSAAKPDRKKVEDAAASLGIDANLLEGLLELIKKVR